MSSNTTKELTRIIAEQFQRLAEADKEEISPAILAASVYMEIDPASVAPDLVREAAILELKQLARAICRERQALAEFESESGDLFDFRLQKRYPAERHGDDCYVLRECLTVDEREANAQRLEKEGAAKLAHADALRAETKKLMSVGVLGLAL